MKPKLDLIERYQAIIQGDRKGTEKEHAQLKRYQFVFAMVCHGFTPMVAAKQLVKREQNEGNTLSFSQSAKLVKEALLIFGKANETLKSGLKYASYEHLMRLAKKAEKKGDYATTRLIIADANKLMGLDQITDGGIENPADYMQPEAFALIDNPKFLDVANKMIEVEWEEAKIIKEEDDE
jgi:hypothetical protein